MTHDTGTKTGLLCPVKKDAMTELREAFDEEGL